MDWTFVYLMVALKIPIAALLWLVWWAVRAEPEVEAATSGEDEDGGSRVERPHPRVPRDPRPRRGPHGDPPARAPERMRRPHRRPTRVG